MVGVLWRFGGGGAGRVSSSSADGRLLFVRVLLRRADPRTLVLPSSSSSRSPSSSGTMIGPALGAMGMELRSSSGGDDSRRISTSVSPPAPPPPPVSFEEFECSFAGAVGRDFCFVMTAWRVPEFVRKRDSS